LNYGIRNLIGGISIFIFIIFAIIIIWLKFELITLMMVITLCLGVLIIFEIIFSKPWGKIFKNISRLIEIVAILATLLVLITQINQTQEQIDILLQENAALLNIENIYSDESSIIIEIKNIGDSPAIITNNDNEILYKTKTNFTWQKSNFNHFYNEIIMPNYVRNFSFQVEDVNQKLTCKNNSEMIDLLIGITYHSDFDKKQENPMKIRNEVITIQCGENKIMSIIRQ